MNIRRVNRIAAAVTAMLAGSAEFVSASVADEAPHRLLHAIAGWTAPVAPAPPAAARSDSSAFDHLVMELTAAMLTRRKAAARATEEHLDSPSNQAVTGAIRISAS